MCISAIYAMVSFSSTGSPTCPFLPSLNLINWNLLWKDWIPDLDWLELLYLLLRFMYLSSGIFVYSLLPGISATSSIAARFYLSRAVSLLSKASVYKLFSLLIGFTKGNIAYASAIGKLFVVYKVSCGTIRCAVPCCNLHVERSLVISQVVLYTFKQYLHFIPAILKDFLLLVSWELYQ